jgi:IS30 family transposase
VPNKINTWSFSRRPAEVTERRTPEHWEGDLIIGRMGSAIGTLFERITKYVVLIHLPHGYKAPQLRDAMISQTSVIPAATRDPYLGPGAGYGATRTGHYRHRSSTCFSATYSPWQRGLNENTNGLLRQ